MERCNAPVRMIQYKLLGNGRKDIWVLGGIRTCDLRSAQYAVPIELLELIG